jgi:hypothetical protein
MSNDERPTWDQFLRTALVLRQTMDRSEDELFEAAWAFLKRAEERYHRYRYNLQPPVWDQGAFVPPLVPLETAARRITAERTKAQAMAALEELLPFEMLEEARERGGLSDAFCAQVKGDYQKGRLESVREKQRQVGKETKNLKRGTKKPKNIS